MNLHNIISKAQCRDLPSSVKNQLDKSQTSITSINVTESTFQLLLPALSETKVHGHEEGNISI